MIKELSLKQEKYKNYEIVDSPNRLKNINKINVFIGQNNSGKSRFLRTLFTDDNFEFILHKKDFYGIKEFLIIKQKEIQVFFQNQRIIEIDNILGKLDEIIKGLNDFRIGEISYQVAQIRNFGTDLKTKINLSSINNDRNFIIYPDHKKILISLNRVGEGIVEVLNRILPADFDYVIDKIYIPILRGLRPIQIKGGLEFNNENSYEARTIKDYFIGHENEVANRIFTGLNLYAETKKQLLGNREKRERIKKFENFLSRSFFEGKDITLIPHVENDVLLIGIGNEERSVYDLGDGIQSLIILLYPLFINQNKNLLVYIEEPEQSMHPGLQRLFLETLMKEEFKNFQFFFTTHSNHFLDITLDYSNISIYTFHKVFNTDTSSFKIEHTSNAEVKILELIGARTSSVFLSNCTIWVEGITDRLYLKKYLEVYQNHLLKNKEIKSLYLEDMHFSFIEYGGNNIVHWSFLEDDTTYNQIKATKISNKIFLITDLDNTKEKPQSKKAQRLAELKSKLGEQFLTIDAREIENTLNAKIILGTVKKFEGKKYEKVVIDTKKLQFKKYKYKPIGTFINDVISGEKRNYADKSGTISSKLEFCKTATALIESYDDLSDVAKHISKKIFEFIEQSNRN